MKIPLTVRDEQRAQKKYRLLRRAQEQLGVSKYSRADAVQLEDIRFRIFLHNKSYGAHVGGVLAGSMMRQSASKPKQGYQKGKRGGLWRKTAKGKTYKKHSPPEYTHSLTGAKMGGRQSVKQRMMSTVLYD